MSLHFTKMHGIGNDFVVVDARDRPLQLDVSQIRRLADRHRGVGFDQLMTIERSSDPDCAWAYGIWNTDGTRARQCGNGVRCVAAWLGRLGLLDAGVVRLMSPSGPVSVELLTDGQVRVDMGQPRFEPAAVPLIGERVGATLYATVIDGAAVQFDALSMGNPHAVIEVIDVDDAQVGTVGPALERSARFPQRCNVGFVQVLSRNRVRLRVWERGVGETLACGTGACAAVASLYRRDRVDEQVDVDLPGGRLRIDWQGPRHNLWMTGPAAFVFEGDWHPD